MTQIEWTDETWNPVTGCTKVSQGCKNCYAERLWPKVEAAERRREHFEWQKVTPRAFTEIRTHPLRLEAPLHWKKPRRIFVNSMSDLFHEDVPRDFIDAVWSTMAEARQHKFQILTKRPARMLEFMKDRQRKGWKANWRNVWLGVSVEDQATADERIPLLLQTPAAVRFISAEPLLGPIDIERYLIAKNIGGPGEATTYGLDWVIAGGESGPKARPSHPHWFANLRYDCKAADVPFFFKQWGEWSPDGHRADEVTDECFVRLDGSTHGYADGEQYEASDAQMHRLGKKAAGRTLDGRTHDDYPEAKP
jgi:protein gp37